MQTYFQSEKLSRLTYEDVPCKDNLQSMVLLKVFRYFISSRINGVTVLYNIWKLINQNEINLFYNDDFLADVQCHYIP